MRGDNNRPLKEWLQVFAQSPQLRDRLYQKRIEKLWEELMGPIIHQYTRRIRLDERVLIQRMNEKLGEDYIREVKIY